MAIDPTHSQAFAQQIAKMLLDIQTKQQDQKQTQRIDGSFDINPQLFQLVTSDNTLKSDIATMTPAAARAYLASRGQLKAHAVTGPIMFTTIFSQAPYVTFGQYPQPTNATTAALGVADASEPFIVQPYVDSWHQSGGQVDGFNLGLYALTTPTPGTAIHTIFWSAYGRGSRYVGRGQQQQASWTGQYNNSVSGSFLTDSSS